MHVLITAASSDVISGTELRCLRLTERQRNHLELWQAAVLDGLARMLDVLHDISDAVRTVAERQALSKQASPIPA